MLLVHDIKRRNHLLILEGVVTNLEGNVNTEKNIFMMIVEKWLIGECCKTWIFLYWQEEI